MRQRRMTEHHAMLRLRLTLALLVPLSFGGCGPKGTKVPGDSESRENLCLMWGCIDVEERAFSLEPTVLQAAIVRQAEAVGTSKCVGSIISGPADPPLQQDQQVRPLQPSFMVERLSENRIAVKARVWLGTELCVARREFDMRPGQSWVVFFPSEGAPRCVFFFFLESASGSSWAVPAVPRN
jgi:hypothetical protein